MGRITSPAIYDALRERYCAPQYALFYEVANGTGSNIRRYCDALAMSLFPSRGLHMHGFEVKVSKQDWRRELDNPHKAEEGIFKFCDHWWIVTPAGLVDKAELPPTWGLLELQVSGDLLKGTYKAALRQAVAAPKLEAQQMSRSFIAALLRRADEANTGRIERAVRERVEKQTSGIKTEIEDRVKERRSTAERKLEKIEAIERQLGMSLSDYEVHEGYGRILKAIDTLGLTRGGWRSWDALLKSAEDFIAKLKAAQAEFDAAAPEVPAPEQAKGKAA